MYRRRKSRSQYGKDKFANEQRTEELIKNLQGYMKKFLSPSPPKKCVPPKLNLDFLTDLLLSRKKNDNSIEFDVQKSLKCNDDVAVTSNINANAHEASNDVDKEPLQPRSK